MKTKLLLTISIVSLLFANLSAQITVTNTDLIPMGYLAYQAYDTMPVASIFPGPGGTNQVWNFSALQHQKYDTLVTLDPTLSPYPSDFTTANYTYKINFKTYGFLENNTTGLYIEGLAGSVGDPGNHIIKEYVAPHSTLMKWPSTYGTNYADNYNITAKGLFDMFAPYDSVKIKNMVTSNCQIDAWGNILTPIGTFPSIRQWRHKMETDTSWLHQIAPPMWVFAVAKKDTIDTYTWWTNNSSIGLPILEMDFDAVADTAANVKWLYATPALGITEEFETFGFATYPNPANNAITIVTKENNNYQISVADITGKLLELNKQTIKNTTTINTENLDEGLYFVMVTDKEGNRSVKKISIIH